MKQIVRCLSCDGYGWFEDAFSDEPEDCDWCGGIGYVYRDAQGTDQRIPEAEYGRVADQLERLERQRMQEIGYTGEPKKPWEQAVRQGTKGGLKPGADTDPQD